MTSARWWPAASCVVFLACGGGGGSTTPTATPTVETRASFTLSGAGYNNDVRTLSGSGGNLIFCRNEPPGPDTLWIRLATSPAGNGDASPHVDIDLCHFNGSGTFSVPHDTSGDRTCSQGQTLGVWWHDGAREFASIPQSSPCTATVTRLDGAIEGTFECRGLEPHGASGDHVDVLNGSFRCRF